MRPEVRGLCARFALPVKAREVVLVSPVAVPRFVDAGDDPRALGLCLEAMALDDGWGSPRAVALEDARLVVGFHDPSPGHRWTAGRARLPAELWGGLAGSVCLRLDLSGPPLPRWVGPAARDKREVDAPTEDPPEGVRLAA